MLKVVVGLCILGLAVAGPPVSRSRDEIQKFKEILESSRNDHGVLLSQRMEENPKANVWENSGKYQGDILLDDEQVEDMVSQYAQGRNAFISPNTRWPGNTVVYEFGAGEFNVLQRNAILNAIRDIERYTCVRFRQRTASDSNYVRITGRSDGCYAHVGYSASRGIHTMNLARANPGRGCFNHVTIIHEWLHIIGFFHMQSTYNRYDFVRIHWDNIVRGMEHNFYRYGNNLVNNLGLPYEYDSCMHYGAYAFSRNNQPTMTATRWHNVEMGQMSYVTWADYLRVSRHYGCL